jgi:hypothetical protein
MTIKPLSWRFIVFGGVKTLFSNLVVLFLVVCTFWTWTKQFSFAFQFLGPLYYHFYSESKVGLLTLIWPF